MDGVITNTAAVHAAAWKGTFDAYLAARSERSSEPFRPFTQDDYLSYVDGRPRYEGVNAFLVSRGIHLPPGEASDGPDCESVCGIGNAKNARFNGVLQSQGVSVFTTTMALVRDLKDSGVKVGVATSSKNGTQVLERADIAGDFEVLVDGVVAAELGLMGKPAPDIFAIACDRLGAARHKTLVVEDAVSGVAAGARGRFGLTLGVARDKNSDALKRHGADLVVGDLSEIGIEEIDRWFETTVRTKPGAAGMESR